MKHNLKMASLFFAGVTGFALFAAEAPKTAAKPAETKAVAAKETPLTVFAALPDVVAEINGVPVKKQEIIDIFMKQFPDGKIPENITVDMVRQLSPMIVKDVVISKLIDKDMEKSGFKPSEEATRKFFSELVKKAPKAQLEMMNQQLSMQGKTLAQYIDEQAKNKEAQLEVARNQYAEATFFKNVKVTDEEAKSFYSQNQDKFKTPGDQPGSIRASHILIAVDAKADDAAKKAALAKINDIKARLIKNPAAFNEIAKAESACPSGARDNGSLGAFTKEQMVPEFSEAAFKLTPGQISDIVTTQYGYHIIRRDASAESKTVPFNEVKERIVAYLTQQKAATAAMDYAKQLEKAAHVKYFVKETSVMPVPAVK